MTERRFQWSILDSAKEVPNQQQQQQIINAATTKLLVLMPTVTNHARKPDIGMST